MIFFILGGIGYATITSKLEEWLKFIWTWIKVIFNFLFSLFTYQVAIWEVLIFLIIIIGSLFLFAIWQDKKINTTTVESITELEKHILRIFENNYGIQPDIRIIAQKLNYNDMLTLEESILNLEYNLKFLKRHDSFMRENTTFTLTGYGRDYILKNLR